MTADRAAGHEHGRQLAHIATAAGALLLRYLPTWQVSILAGAALAFNHFALPRLRGGRLFREFDHSPGYSTGILLYPLAIVTMTLLFPARPDIVAATWGIMAVGDGIARLTGTSFGGPTIPWNPRKRVAASVAFGVCGGVAGSCLAWWCRPAVVPPAYFWFSLAAPLAAAVLAALVETVPITLDDNVTVPGVAAGTLWAASLMNGEMLATAAAQAIAALPLAAGLNALVAWLGYHARTVSTSGAVTGAAIGATIFLSLGWRGWALLMITFVAASAVSRVGLRRKRLLGIAEERGGRRGVGNALANTGLAAGAAVLAVTTYATDAALLAFVAALTAGGSDTIASELGKAFGRRTFMVHTLGPVAPGTSGAISLEGTAAGVGGALALAGAGVGLGLIPGAALLPIVAGATIGAFAESVLGATLEHRGVVNNDALNFLNTGVAVWAAILIAGWT